MFDRAVVERAVFDPAQVSGQIAPVVYQPLSGPVPETSRVPAALSGGIEVLPYAR